MREDRRRPVLNRLTLMALPCAAAVLAMVLAGLVTYLVRTPAVLDGPGADERRLRPLDAPHRYGRLPQHRRAPAAAGRASPASEEPTVGAALFRIARGTTAANVLRRLKADAAVTFDLPGADATTVMAHLGLGRQHAEGLFLPGTYRAGRASEILREAHGRLRATLEDAWRRRAPGLPYLTPYDALIVASIVEKETALAEDRPRIAAVFTRRLRRGMRLQADPTVTYGLGSPAGPITRAHLATDTPYNTYTRGGLPPTPIALVGHDAITAALHPSSGTSLYFIGRGDGTSQFSDTLAEHNAAVRRYLRPPRGGRRRRPNGAGRMHRLIRRPTAG
ncbi:MAG: endolytic transglycosylase MltG [Gammaproteobacteria bacterium]|nr:endolytic transglycosylase MltG [Gammaproteobacteria bacterium]